MKKMRKSASNVNNAVNLISGAYTLPLIDKLFSNSQRIENMDDVYFAITALVDTDRIGLSSESIGDKCAGRFRTDGDGCAPFGGCGRKTGGGNVYKPIRHIARSTRFQPAQDW